MDLQSLQLEALRLSMWLSGIDSLDIGLGYQLCKKDDATLALWTAVGVEALTLAVALGSDPTKCFSGSPVPCPKDLAALDFRTSPLRELADVAMDHYPGVPYPADAERFARAIRNKILHTGLSSSPGLVGPSLRLMSQTADWIAGVRLPTLRLRSTPRVVGGVDVGGFPDQLKLAVSRVASENAGHLRASLESGAWDGDESQKEVAQRELADCEALC